MSRKRKHTGNPRSQQDSTESFYLLTTNPESPSASSQLFIQAHEADIVCGDQAAVVAASLEVQNSDPGAGLKIGSALIRWGGDASGIGLGDEDCSTSEAGHDVWVDRYASACVLYYGRRFEKLKLEVEGNFEDRVTFALCSLPYCYDQRSPNICLLDTISATYWTTSQRNYLPTRPCRLLT